VIGQFQAAEAAVAEPLAVDPGLLGGRGSERAQRGANRCGIVRRDGVVRVEHPAEVDAAIERAVGERLVVAGDAD